MSTISTSIRSTPATPTAAGSVVPPFVVVPGYQVEEVLDGRENLVVDLIEAAYLRHDAGQTVNPPSYFLTFPDRPGSRIIALPAALSGPEGVDGLKWVSSFPENVASGIPRASALLLLNDPATGYPTACLEGSIISAARTAASAALAARVLAGGRRVPRRVGFFGVGLIARYIHRYLTRTGFEFQQVGVYDVLPDSVEGFTGYLAGVGAPGEVTVHSNPESLIRSSDLVVFATVAGRPHVHELSWFEHCPIVLHVSLRDLSAEVVLGTTTIVDDVDHCLRADTSPHLAERLTGSRDFVAGTLADVITGRVVPPTDRPVVFSPFGLGVLDLALGRHVLNDLRRSDRAMVVDRFFHELRRYG